MGPGGLLQARRSSDGFFVSALAGTISSPFVAGRDGLDPMRWLRSALSLALALGILAVALPMAFNAGARGAGVDPVQVFSSGSAISIDSSGGARLSLAGIVPGQRRTATIRVSNAGSGAADFSLSTHLNDRVGPGGLPLSETLDLRIVSPGGTILYEGALAGLDRLQVGRIGAGQTRAFGFTVSLPSSAGNEVEGSTLSAGFAWQAS